MTWYCWWQMMASISLRIVIKDDRIRYQYNILPNYYWLMFPTSIDFSIFNSSFPTAIIISNSIENLSTSAVTFKPRPGFLTSFLHFISNFPFSRSFQLFVLSNCPFQLMSHKLWRNDCVAIYRKTVLKFRQTHSGFYIGIGDFSISFFIQNWCSVEAQKFYY